VETARAKARAVFFCGRHSGVLRYDPGRIDDAVV